MCNDLIPTIFHTNIILSIGTELQVAHSGIGASLIIIITLDYATTTEQNSQSWGPPGRHSATTEGNVIFFAMQYFNIACLN